MTLTIQNLKTEKIDVLDCTHIIFGYTNGKSCYWVVDNKKEIETTEAYILFEYRILRVEN